MLPVEKIGSIGDVRVGSDIAGAAGVVDAEELGFFEVRSGPLGLGKHLWFAARDIQDVGKKRVTPKYTKQSASTGIRVDVDAFAVVR